MPTPRDLLNEAKASIREVDQADAQALLDERRRDVPRRARARRVRAGRHPRRRPPAPRPPRVPGRGQAPRQVGARRRLLRRRHALGLRRQDPGRARLHRRGSRSSAASTVEGRGPALGGARRPSPPSQRNRYQRHLLLPEVGEAGQLKLLDSKVLLLGAGGLGSPAALYLAAAGVGTIGIIDMDVVDESNLQRQILHNMDRIGERKVDSAKKTLTALNPDVERRHLRRAARRRQHPRHHRRLRRHRRRHRQLPDPLPGQRRLAAQADPRGPRVDLPLRGPGHGVRPLRRARATAA